MVRLVDIPEKKRRQLEKLDCPVFERTPWVRPPELKEARVCIISTAGIHLADDGEFALHSADFRVIPGDVTGADITMSHVSPSFDRTGFSLDVNVVFPVDRLRELEAKGIIGSTAKNHYSFMGATDPRDMEPEARNLASILKGDLVNVVLLVPV